MEDRALEDHLKAITYAHSFASYALVPPGTDTAAPSRSGPFARVQLERTHSTIQGQAAMQAAYAARRDSVRQHGLPPLQGAPPGSGLSPDPSNTSLLQGHIVGGRAAWQDVGPDGAAGQLSRTGASSGIPCGGRGVAMSIARTIQLRHKPVHVPAAVAGAGGPSMAVSRVAGKSGMGASHGSADADVAQLPDQASAAAQRPNQHLPDIDPSDQAALEAAISTIIRSAASTSAASVRAGEPAIMVPPLNAAQARATAEANTTSQEAQHPLAHTPGHNTTQVGRNTGYSTERSAATAASSAPAIVTPRALQAAVAARSAARAQLAIAGELLELHEMDLEELEEVRGSLHPSLECERLSCGSLLMYGFDQPDVCSRAVISSFKLSSWLLR